MKNLNSLFLVVITILVAVGCGGGASQTEEGGPIRVVATTTIVGDMVRSIGGDDVQVDVLMGPGIDPHLYKASAGDVRRMDTAEAIFYNGLHLEGKMTEVLERMGDRGATTVAIAECVPEEDLIELEGYSGLHDPHVWFDVSLWKMTSQCVADALAGLDPPNAPIYDQRAKAYADELEALDSWIHERVDALEPQQKVLVTAHDAFSYFGRAYGFEVRGLLGVSTAAEAGTSDVQRLAEFIVKGRIPAIFVETSVPPRYVQALQEAVASRGFDVRIGTSLYSDSLGDAKTPAGTYPGTVRANVESIVAGLSGGGDAN